MQAQITFDDEISMSFLNYASSHNLTLFQLGLATFYVFLYKLTHGQTDLCISSVNANRYRSELQDVMGMFVATLPTRLRLDSQCSFDEVVKHVREKCLSVLKHSHYSLQQILADFRLNQSNVPFLETMFDFIIVSTNVHRVSLTDGILEEIQLQQLDVSAKFDFSVTFSYNPALKNNKLASSFICSRDLYEEKTVIKIAERFQHLFNELFTSRSLITETDQCITSISKLSLILPEENEAIRRNNLQSTSKCY